MAYIPEESVDLRTLPCSLEAERSVLGSMLKDPQAVLLATETLKGHDFFSPAHAEIFAAMLHLSLTMRPIDFITVDEELTRRGKSDGVGGAAYLVELTQFVPITSNVNAYIRIVEDKSTLRKLILASQDISQDSYAATKELSQILESAEKRIFDISMKSGGGALEPISEALVSTFDRIEQLYKNKGGIDGVPTGYKLLDHLLTGLHGGEMVLIAARPSVGKSTLAMNIAENASIDFGKRVAVFSLEMPTQQLVMRMMCSRARVDMQKVRHGTLEEDDWARLIGAMGELSTAKVHFDSTSAITVPDMRSRCRRLMMEKGLDLIIIDYIQLMSTSGRHGNRQEEISEISRSLKALAQELNLPVVALSQLSRAPQARSDKRPILSDIRDSGAIEQDADIVLFLYRDDYYDAESDDRGVAEIIVAKQRNGPLGTVRVQFQSQFTRFHDMA